MTRQIAFLRSPFAALVRHFSLRLFASEEEQGTAGLGLGLGAVLAMVASPGAFASILLMGKYSTLLQWVRGEYIDAVRRSPADEYFFVVLSMTITGLLMVARWNRLFPDRRDFANLAVLPIPIRHIFLANFVALLGLAILFGVVINAVSAFLFPLFVTLSIDTGAAFLRVAAAHAATVLLASLFSFFAVFGLVGLLSLIVPRAIFRAVSVATRILLVVLLLTEFFSNLLLQLFAGHLPGDASGYMQWVPSFWFLGFYERMLGIAKPLMLRMASVSLLALPIVMVVAAIMYALCYRRIFVRLPESFDIAPSSRVFFRLRLPEVVLRSLFRSTFERACNGFVRKVLLRSESHLMFLGAYLGIGLVLVAQTGVEAKSPMVVGSLPTSAYLSLPLLIAFFLVSGFRFVFDMPAVAEANWVFQITTDAPQPTPREVVKRIMLLTTIPWQILLLLPLSSARGNWRFACIHLVFVSAVTVLFIDVLLLRFTKIPFTCVTQVDIRRFIMRMLAMIFLVLAIVPTLAELEHWMFDRPLRFAGFALLLSGSWYALIRLKETLDLEDEGLSFEEGPGPAFELLKLS